MSGGKRFIKGDHQWDKSRVIIHGTKSPDNSFDYNAETLTDGNRFCYIERIEPQRFFFFIQPAINNAAGTARQTGLFKSDIVLNNAV